MRLLALPLAFLALAAPAPAQPPIAAALTDAQAFWQATPCAPTIVLADMPGIYGQTFTNTCTIRLNRSLWPTSRAQLLGWTSLCLTVVHEYGHLVLGPAFAATNPSDPFHSPDPRSIMYYRASVVPAPCATARVADGLYETTSTVDARGNVQTVTRTTTTSRRVVGRTILARPGIATVGP